MKKVSTTTYSCFLKKRKDKVATFDGHFLADHNNPRWPKVYKTREGAERHGGMGEVVEAEVEVIVRVKET